MAGMRAESLGHAAWLLHCQLTHADCQVGAPALDLAEGLMTAGLELAGDAEAIGMLKHYLPGILKVLSARGAHAGRYADPKRLSPCALYLKYYPWSFGRR